MWKSRGENDPNELPEHRRMLTRLSTLPIRPAARPTTNHCPSTCRNRLGHLRTIDKFGKCFHRSEKRCQLVPELCRCVKIVSLPALRSFSIYWGEIYDKTNICNAFSNDPTRSVFENRFSFPTASIRHCVPRQTAFLPGDRQAERGQLGLSRRTQLFLAKPANRFFKCLFSPTKISAKLRSKNKFCGKFYYVNCVFRLCPRRIVYLELFSFLHVTNWGRAKSKKMPIWLQCCQFAYFFTLVKNIRQTQ